MVPRLDVDPVGNPSQGVAVRIAEVVDARPFQASPSVTLMPSLSAATRDPAGRSRAIGRSTTPSGLPGAVVQLAPGLTVEGLVRGVAGRALRGAGFRVQGAGPAGSASVPQLRVTIEQLWMRESVRSAGAATEIEIRVRVAGPLPGIETGLLVSVHEKVVRGGFTRSLWRQTLEVGLEGMIRDLEDELARVRAAVDAAG